MGDPSGIGPEIIPEALQRLGDDAECVVIGDKWVIQEAQSSKPKTQSIRLIDLDNVNHKTFSFGKIKAEYGKASIEYIDRALELIQSQEIDCLVTCPISKEAIEKAGFRKFSGHTEYLARRTNSKDFLMMLINERLRFSLVTRHIPLNMVSLKLDKNILKKTIVMTNDYLIKLFSILSPRIVVCAVNPHASDNGLIGSEENRIIKPTVQALRKKIRHLDGPLPADVAIARAARGEYDAVIAMYHDQALIPLKLLRDHTGVNITLGLPFVRTSPLHGTAFDIAGKGLADAQSLIQSIKLAVECSLNLKRA